MRKTSTMRAAIGILVLVFATAPGGPAAGEDGSTQGVGEPENTRCPVLESADWTAWVTTQPGSSEPGLHLSGRVVLPTPGFAVQGRLAALDRRQPPSQRVLLDFVPPDGVVAQVLSTEDVQLTFPALANAYRAIIVICGDATLGEITDVAMVQ